MRWQEPGAEVRILYAEIWAESSTPPSGLPQAPDVADVIASAEPDGEAVTLTVEAPPDVLRTTILKGSVAVAGVSLTVTAVDDASFSVSLTRLS